MNEFQKNNTCVINNKSCPVKSRPSLFTTLDKVKAQVEYQDFAKPLHSGKLYVDPLIDEICLIIAEVLVRSPKSIIKIRGSEIEAAIVQEVYSKLDHERVELVVDNFRKQTHPIRNKSAYLQTALYNCVFEFNAHYTNLVANDVGGLCGIDGEART